MSSSDNMPGQPSSRLPSHTYARDTGNTTRDLFAQVVDLLNPFTADSILHDNAANAAIATSATLSKIPPRTFPGKVLVTDLDPGTIEAANDIIATNHWGDVVTARVLDAQDMSGIPDGHFSHSVTNFSVFTFKNATAAAGEIYRTTKPRGQVVVTTWERFGAGEVVHAIQQAIRPDLPVMPFVGSTLYTGKYVAKLLAEVGLDEGSVQIVQRELVLKPGEDLEGLRGFINGFLKGWATRGWGEDDMKRWDEVSVEVIGKEVNEFGGIRFAMAGVLGRK